MNKDATNFIRNRKVVVSITYNRIVHIVNYVIDCYQLLANSSVQYSKSEISRISTISPEDYLKMNLVDRYLIPNKELIIAQCKDLETINFHYEPQKRYVDVTDNKEKPDKIDIYINRLAYKINGMKRMNIYTLRLNAKGCQNYRIAPHILQIPKNL